VADGLVEGKAKLFALGEEPGEGFGLGKEPSFDGFGYDHGFESEGRAAEGRSREVVRRIEAVSDDEIQDSRIHHDLIVEDAFLDPRESIVDRKDTR
jgi:hypothetical protein